MGSAEGSVVSIPNPDKHSHRSAMESATIICSLKSFNLGKFRQNMNFLVSFIETSIGLNKQTTKEKQYISTPREYSCVL